MKIISRINSLVKSMSMNEKRYFVIQNKSQDIGIENKYFILYNLFIQSKQKRSSNFFGEHVQGQREPSLLLSLFHFPDPRTPHARQETAQRFTHLANRHFSTFHPFFPAVAHVRVVNPVVNLQGQARQAPCPVACGS